MFLAASLTVVGAAAVIPHASGPPAMWDNRLSDPPLVRAGVPFSIEAEARNPGTAQTDRVWLLVDWRPAESSITPAASGRFMGCSPATCNYRDDPTAGRTIVYWPGLPGGGRQVYRLTVSVTGVAAGDTLEYRVSSGTGPNERTVDEGLTWNVELKVE